MLPFRLRSGVATRSALRSGRPRVALNTGAAQPARALHSSGARGEAADIYAGEEPESLNQEQYRSVVKVFNVMSRPNYLMPWQNKPHHESTGSGFVIEGRRIITNAHVVSDTKHCQLRKHGEATKFTATVVGVSHECDLAMLAVEDDAFWTNVQPLPLGVVPQLQEAVTVVGYPQGGDNISVTGGVVSRVDFQQYAHGASHMLAVQIDAAINPGNSGGPAMLNGEVAGVAFQNLIGAENIGFIIPTTIVRHFIDEIDQRGTCAFPSLGVLCQPMDSPSLRGFLGLDAFPQYVGKGVLINRVLPLCSASGALQPRDVLLEFEGEQLGCDGTVHFRGHERTSFEYLVTGSRVGQVVSMTILRGGELQEVSCTLEEGSPLVPVHNYDRLPSYFICAGFVFADLTQPYLHEFGEDWYNQSPRRLCTRALHGVRKTADDEVVVMSQVLAHAVNNGYQGYNDLEVRRVNGSTVRNLRHLKNLVEVGRSNLPSLPLPSPPLPSPIALRPHSGGVQMMWPLISVVLTTRG